VLPPPIFNYRIEQINVIFLYGLAVLNVQYIGQWTSTIVQYDLLIELKMKTRTKYLATSLYDKVYWVVSQIKGPLSFSFSIPAAFTSHQSNKI